MKLKKLRKLSFDNYKFISAGKEKPTYSNRHHTMERKKISKDIFSMDSYEFLKKVGLNKRHAVEIGVKMDIM